MTPTLLTNCNFWPHVGKNQDGTIEGSRVSLSPKLCSALSDVSGNETVADSNFHQVSLGWDCALMSFVWPFLFANLWTVTQHSC